jgi:hypothetical protein
VREGLQELKAQGYQQDIDVFRSLEMRYLGQNYELELPIAIDALEDGAADRLWDQFHEAHRARFATLRTILEIVNYWPPSAHGEADLHRLPADGPPQPVGRHARASSTALRHTRLRPRLAGGGACHRRPGHHRRSSFGDRPRPPAPPDRRRLRQPHDCGSPSALTEMSCASPRTATTSRST